MTFRAVALLAVAVVSLTIAAGSAAGAHANYARSEPAPNAHLTNAPPRVLVGFSEKFVVASSGLTLLDRDGREVASQAQTTTDPSELALPLPALGSGVYTVAWHTVSAVDGDAASGYFAFEVGTSAVVNAPTVSQSKTQNGVTVMLAVSPALAGRNSYVVTARRGDATLANVTRIRLRVTPLDGDIGLSENILAASAPAPGVFAGSGYELPFAGRYRVEVQVRRSDTVDDLAFDFDVAIRSGAAASPSASAVASPSASAASVSSSGPSPVGEAPALPLAAILAAVAAALAIAAVVLFARRRA